MDNILVFTSDYSLVKLADFGSTRKAGTLVRRRHELLPSCPPEVAEAVYNEGYHVTTGHDVWQLGILVFVLLTGTLPWQKADETVDRLYAPFYQWQQRRTSKIPAKFKYFTGRLQRLLRRLLDPKEETRVPIQGTPANKCSKETYRVIAPTHLVCVTARTEKRARVVTTLVIYMPDPWW